MPQFFGRVYADKGKPSQNEVLSSGGLVSRTEIGGIARRGVHKGDMGLVLGITTGNIASGGAQLSAISKGK